MKKLLFFVASIAVLASCAKGYYDGMPSAPGYPGYGWDQESGDRFEAFADNEFIDAAEEPQSTFSVDADGAAYAVARNYVNSSYMPPQNAIRIEEFINYFPFDYAEPQGDESLAINAEVGACPWSEKHKLMRLGLKGKSLDEKSKPLSNYVFLVDVSGSMNSEDKLPLLKKGLISLLPKLDPQDRISIVTYSGKVQKVLESTLVKDADVIKNAINNLVASGVTNGGEAIKMAYQEALDNYIEGGNNRIILGTDGDFNVGITSTDGLLELVESYAEKGIYLTALGFGMGNLNDAMMENISNSGNGTYFFIDSEYEMTKVFVNEIGKFFSVANDCKVQITFNPEYVKSYRLIGYENRVMSSEDFDNDRKDAAEIGAGQTITALYEIIPTAALEEGSPAVAKFDVRYKKELGAESRLLSMDVNGIGEGSENLNFASAVTAYGMVLRNSKFKGAATLDMARELAQSSLSFDPFDYRKEFISLIDKTAELKSKQK